MRIVGVAADGTLGDPRAGDQPAVYVNYWQQDSDYQRFPMLLVRSDAPLADVTLRIREEIAEAGREYPLAFSLVVDNLDDALVQERLLAITSAMFAAIGLLLAGIGLFGVVERGRGEPHEGTRHSNGRWREPPPCHRLWCCVRRCSRSGSESP